MDKFTDKLCDLIVKCARFINALMPLMIGLVAAYFIGMFIVAMCLK
jgi:hypothetical protein